ncbi:MAG: DUF4340 domain-containing protein, partial [Clostridia bacterium]|nr:DUF4340 domain-containing protein [Clostridia bacterium]
FSKQLILPACLLGVLIVGPVLVLALGGEDSTSATTTRTSVDYLYYANETDVALCTLENESGKLVLERTEKKDDAGAITQEWTVKSPANPAYDATSVENLATSFRTISSTRIIAESVTPADLSKYGLDKPSAKLTVKETDGDTVVILLGNPAGSGSSYYAMAEGADKVHLVATSVGDALLAEAMDYLGTALCSAEYDSIKTVGLKRGSDDLDITARSTPFYDDSGALVELQWQFTKPLVWMADTLSIQPVIEEIIAAVATDFVAMDVSESDLAQYGLDDPSYVFEVTDENQTYTITLGASAGSGLLFGTSSRIPGAVFVTATESFTLVDAPFMQWVNGFVYLADITKVTRIDLKFDKVDLDIEVDAKAEPNVFSIDGKDANIVNSNNKNYFKSFYQAIIGATLAGVDMDAKPDLSDAIVTIRYTLREGDPVNVAFVPRDPYSLYAFVDGKYTGGYVDIDVLDDTDYSVGNVLPSGLRPAYQGMVNAMAKAVDGVYN